MPDTPQTANAPPPQYPSVPSPSQDPASMQASIERLIEGYNLLTGQTGVKSYSMQEGLTEIRKQFGTSTGRLLQLNEVTVEANRALVQRTTLLEIEVTDARGIYGTLGARITDVQTVVGDATSGLVQATNNLTLEVTTARNGHTTLNQYLSVIDSALTGVSLRYGLQGTINGVTGGFVFTGVLKNDGTVVYNLEITSNVIIHGSLTIDGTLTNPKYANNSVTQMLASSGTGGAAVSITLRGTGTVLILCVYEGAPFTYQTSPTSVVLQILRDGTAISTKGASASRDTTYSLSGSTLTATVLYAFQETTLFLVDSPGPGSYTYSFTSSVSHVCNMAVIELSK